MINELSFWEKEALLQCPDFTVIGSGIVGLSTAISIKELNPGKRVIVLERAPYPLGASTRNAGFACFGSVSELLDDLDKMPKEDCIELVKMRWDGLRKLRSRIPDSAMNYFHLGGHEVFRKADKDLENSCLSRIDICNKLINEAVGLDNCYQVVDCPPFFSGMTKKAIFNPHEGQLNPVQMMNALYVKAISLGIQVLYGMEILEINFQDKKLVVASDILIPFQKLIICTNAFTHSILPEVKVLPVRNQVLVTKPIPGMKIKGCFHMDRGYLYFRNVDNRILIGGGRNISFNEESTDAFGTTPLILNYLKLLLKDLFGFDQVPEIDHVWSGILGVHDSKRPIIEWYNEDVLLGVRLGGMGVAIGSFMGEKLASIALEAE